MITFGMGEEMFRDIKEHPRDSHWNRSMFESVIGGVQILFANDYEIFTKRRVSLIPLKDYSKWEVRLFKEGFSKACNGDFKSFEDIEKFYWDGVIKNLFDLYEPGKEELEQATDYTLFMRQHHPENFRAYVNYRVFHESSKNCVDTLTYSEVLFLSHIGNPGQQIVWSSYDDEKKISVPLERFFESAGIDGPDEIEPGYSLQKVFRKFRDYYETVQSYYEEAVA